jgi:capsular exopolysaccharide synthesis family protein
MTPVLLQPRIPDAIPIEVDPPRVVNLPPSQPAAPPDAGSGLKPLNYLRYRWATVVFLGGLLAGVFAFTAYSLIPAKYTTYSIIRVAPHDPRIYYSEDPQGRGDFNSYLKTQAGLLRSHFVLTAALRDPEVAALPMLKAQEDPIRFLEEELQIDFSDGSELIKPKLSGDDPRAITMIVNAIHRAFFAEVVDAERRRKQARLAQIEKSVAALQLDLEKKSPAAAPVKPGDQPAESLPGVGPQLASTQVARLREALDTAVLRQKQLEDEKKRLARRRDNLAAELPPLPPGFMAQLEGDPAIARTNRQVETWQKQLDYLVRLNGDANSPGAKELKQKIAEAGQERDRVRKERVEEFQKVQLVEVGRRLQLDDEKIDSDLAALKIFQDQKQKELKEYEAKLASILPDAETPKDFGKVDRKSQSDIISGLIDKRSLLQLELNAPPRVMPIQEAAVPMKREMKKQLLGTIAAAIFGFGLVGLGVVGYESRVRRALSLADVQKATLGPVIGAIPAVRFGQPGGDLALAEEAIEKTRANLIQQFGRPGGKVVMVTSALTDEGRTFLARELALSFARAGGQTLLVDFDLRAPSLHEPFEVANEVGFCELLTGESDLPTAAKILPHGIALLTAGRWADVVRQYLSADRIGTVLGELRARFDYVIVNAHPILSVAETALAGRAADAIVLTVEKYESRLPLVSRAQEKVATLAPDAFGVVVLGASREESLQ